MSDRQEWNTQLEPFLAGCPELEIPAMAVSAPSLVSAISAEEYLAKNEEEGLVWEACRVPSWKRASVSAKPGMSEQKSILPPDGLVGHGMAWGELIHRLLEQAVAHPEMTGAEMESMARWYTFEEPELVELIPAPLMAIEEIKKSDFWARVSSATDRLVEVPFGQRVDSTLLMGIIDLVLRQEDGWDIVDYKTDRQRLEALIAKYAGQVQQYAASWKSIVEASVNFLGIYAVREGKLSEDLGS